MSDDFSSLVGFQGQARLFPLPNLVLFPHAVQPLHIFEPRYRQMTRDALNDDRLIAVVLLQPGWEANYDGSPSLFPVACLGKIIAEQKLKDGRFNILLRGLTRIHLSEEIAGQKKYRQARVAILTEHFVPPPDREKKLRRQIGRHVPRWFATHPLPMPGDLLDHFRQLLTSELSLGTLCDILAFALPFDVPFKQELLGELNVERRARRLLQALKNKPSLRPVAEIQRKFPPKFSVN